MICFVELHSKNLSLTKNYEINDKLDLAINDAFEEWKHLLELIQHIITMYINHKNLEYFMIVQIINH
jgi:hypothetical protein